SSLANRFVVGCVSGLQSNSVDKVRLDPRKVRDSKESCRLSHPIAYIRMARCNKHTNLPRGQCMGRPVNQVRLRWTVCGLLFFVTTANYMDRSALGLVEPILKHLLGGDQDPAVYNRHYSEIVNCFIVAYG